MADQLVNGGHPFLGGEAHALGLSRGRLRALIDGGRIRRIFLGVYVDATVADNRKLRAAALHLVKPAGGVFYGATAAFLLGVDAFPPGQRFDFKPQCVVPHHEGRSKRETVICHEGYLPPADVHEIEGLLATTAVRTTVDMLRFHWRPYALGAADAMAHAGLVTRDEVAGYVRRMRRFPGIVQARALLVLIEPKVESPGESSLRLRLYDAGMPIPEAQIIIRNSRGREIYRLDDGYREARVGTEYDGREWHDDDEARDYDEGRDVFLRDSLGWRLRRARRADIFGSDASFEQEVGEWLGIAPRARRW